MDKKRPDTANSFSPGAVVQGQVTTGDAQPSAGLYASDLNKYYLDSSLEVKQQSPTAVVGSAVGDTGRMRLSRGFTGLSRRKALVVSAVITLVVTAITGASILLLARNAPDRDGANKAQIQTQDVSLKDADLDNIPDELQGAQKSLLVNGDIITRGSLKLSSGGFVTVIRANDLQSNQTFTLPNSTGTLCLDSNNCNFASLEQLTALQAQLGEITPTLGVQSLNQQAGTVAIQGVANRISVITANGVITLATPQDLGTISSPTFASLILSGNLNIGGTLRLPFDCSGQINGGALTTNASGEVICSSDDGGSGAGVGTSGAASVGTIPLFTTTTNIEESIISQALGTITISGSLNLANALAVTNGGTGATTLANNGVIIGHGTGALTSTVAGGVGQCLVSTAGAPTFQTCPGSGGVASINALTSAVTIAGTANRISVNSNGVDTITLSTPQDIGTGSSPTFAGLTVSGLTSGVVRATAGVLSVGPVNLSTEVSGVLAVANGGTGVNASSAANGQLLIGNGNGFTLNTITAGSGVNIVNNAGSITISAPGSGTCATCADRTLNNLLGVAIQGDDLKPGTAGAIDLGTNALPFGEIFISGSSSNPGSNNFRITGSATQQRIITLPDVSGTVCVDGSCAGLGGGITGTGAAGTIAKFTSNGAIGNSLLTESGSMVTVAGSVTINSNLIVSGILTSGTINGLTLLSNTNGFHITGGVTPATLTVTADSTINQNLRTTDSPTFANLTLSNALTTTNGGTGRSDNSIGIGKILVGNGSGYSLTNILTDGNIIIDDTSIPGTIQLSAPAIGDCDSCADKTLSNLQSVAINTSLLPDGTNTVHLGATNTPFQSLHINSTAGAQGFLITGNNISGSEVTLTLPALNGTFALLQTSGSSTAQTGDINVLNNIIAGRVVSTLLGSADLPSGNTGNVVIRSGTASSGNSGNVTIDVGNASGIKGTITLGGTQASDLILGRAGLEAKLPGGLTTQGSNIVTANGNLDLGTGTITSGAINGQVLDPTLSIFSSNVWIDNQGLLVGSDTLDINGSVGFMSDDGQVITIRTDSTAATYELVLPSTLGNSGDCLKDGGSGFLVFDDCAAGIASTGSDNYIPVFTNSGSQITDSLLYQDTTGNPFIQVQGSLVIGDLAGATPGSLIMYDIFGSGNSVEIGAADVSASYSLLWPKSYDSMTDSGKCLSVGSGGQLDWFPCTAGGGSGSGDDVVANAATTGYLARWVDGAPNFELGDSVIQDNGSRVGINVAPDGTAVLNVGSSGNFKVTNAGALTVNGISNNNANISNVGSLGGVTTLTASGLLQTTANNQALTLSGTPTNNATQSLIQIGSAITGGNNSANGGTYIGLNAPSSGAGSAADFINFQKNGVTQLRVTSGGALTTSGTLTVGAGGLAVTGNSSIAGTLGSLTGLTSSGTITFSGLNTAGIVTNTSSGVLGTVPIVPAANGGTGVDASAVTDGQLLIGNGAQSRFDVASLTSNDSSVTINVGAGTIDLSAPNAGSCSSCANRNLGNLQSVAINTSLLPATAGAISLGSTSASYANLYVGASSGNTIRLTGTAAGNRTLTLPDPGQDATICVKYGANLSNCGGAGGGITGGGTQNRIPKFDSSGNAIQDSNISDNGSTVAITGALTVSTTASITGGLTAASFNDLVLQTNTTGFQISGGTNSRTLVVEDNATINQNLRTTDTPTFANVNLTGNLSVSDGGTGVSTIPTNGQLLIGNGTGYTVASLTTDGTVNISVGAGSIQLSAPNAGSCSTCANQTLSNLNATSINQDLVASGNNTRDLGSSLVTWRSGYFGTNVNTPALLSSGALIINSANGNNLTIASGTTGDITLDSGSTGDVNIGTGANAKTINIGNTMGATGVNINTGSGGLDVNGNVTLSSGSNFTMQSGTGTFSQTHSSNSGTAFTLAVTNSGTSGTNTIQGMAINVTGTNNAGGSNITNALFFGNVAAATNNTYNAISLGTGYTNLITAANFTVAGSGNITTSGTYNGNTFTNGALTFSVAGSAQIQAATNQALTLGNTSGSSTLNLQAGSGNVNITTPGQVKIGTADTTATLFVVDIKTDAGDPTGTPGAMYYNDSLKRFRCYQDSAWKDCDVTSNTSTKKIILTPEYAGAVLDTSGGNGHVGYLTSAFDGTNRRNYYRWTTSESSANDYDVVLSIPLPSDFNAWTGSPHVSLMTRTSNLGGSTGSSITIANAAGSIDTGANAASIIPSSTNTWDTKSFTLSGSYTKDTIITIRIHVVANAGSTFDLGELILTYTN